MKSELKESYDAVNALFEQRADVEHTIAIIGSDEKKYGGRLQEIQAMSYVDITDDVVSELAVVRARMDLLPVARTQAEKLLVELSQEVHGAIAACSRILDGIFSEFSDGLVKRLVKSLVSNGFSKAAAEKMINESDRVREARNLSGRIGTIQFYGYRAERDDFLCCVEAKKQLDVFVQEALNDKSNFEQFLSAE